MISIIVPTYNGKNKISNLLRTLSTQSFSEFEVVVVIDGSNDGSEALLKEKHYGLKLKVIVQSNKGRASARNTGVESSSGNIIIFFDDDVVPQSSCVERHMSFHSNQKSSMLVGGCSLSPNHYDHPAFTRYRINREKKWLRKIRFKERINLGNYVFTTQNLSLRRTLFEEIGGFDERLRDSEDFEFSMKAIKKNIPIYFDLKTFVFHEDRAGLKAYINRQIEYNKSKQHLLKLNPEYASLHPDSFVVSKWSLFGKLVKSLLGRIDYWEENIETGWCNRIPDLLKFKFLDLLIHYKSRYAG